MGEFFHELRRRNIFRVAGVYGVIAWLLVQVAATLESAVGLPTWFDGFVVAILLIGFPIAMILAWAFEITPEGMKLNAKTAGGANIAPKPAGKLDYVIIGGLVLVGMMIVADRMMPEKVATAARDDLPASTAEEVADASIAILPFADLSPDGDQEYFSDGMAEEILNVLVRVDGMKVASRTSSFQFKGRELGIPEIANQLNVRHVLEGSVRKSGKTIRITAQLIDAQTDQHLWSQTYDRTLSAENIFAIQDEIANEIVKQLGIKMGGDNPEIPKVRVAAGTENLDAYELFLRAHNKFITRNDIPGTIALFERAVAADPDFARAWAGLAAVYSVAPGWGVLDRDYIALADKSANTAIALNPDLALPYAVLGNLESNKFPNDFTKAFAFFDQAIMRDPKEASAWLWRGIINNTVGYFDKAEQDLARCLALDPAYENCRGHIAFSKLYTGDTKRALEVYEQSLMNGADIRGAIHFLPAYAAMGDLSTVRNMIPYITTFFGTGDDGDIRKLAYRAVTQPDFNVEKERDAIESAYERATGKPLDWASAQGQFLAMFFRNYAAVKNPGIELQAWWRPYPAALRASPHRKRWMIETGLPAYWREHGFPPQCKPVGEDDFECD